VYASVDEDRGIVLELPDGDVDAPTRERALEIIAELGAEEEAREVPALRRAFHAALEELLGDAQGAVESDEYDDVVDAFQDRLGDMPVERYGMRAIHVDHQLYFEDEGGKLWRIEVAPDGVSLRRAQAADRLRKSRLTLPRALERAYRAAADPSRFLADLGFAPRSAIDWVDEPLSEAAFRALQHAAVPYDRAGTLAVGTAVTHAKFGAGVVLAVDEGKARIQFTDRVRTLAAKS
jgi:hypothetical protein